GDAAGASAISEHDAFFRTTLHTFNGHEEVHTGDGFFATFDRPSEAAKFAVAFQLGLSTLDLPEPMETRIGIHMGEIVQVTGETREGPQTKLSGLAVDIASRVMRMAQGKQILLTRGVFDASRQLDHDRINDLNLLWLAHGAYFLKGIDERVDIFELGIPNFSPLARPEDSEKARSATRAGDEITLGWRPAVGLEIPKRENWVLEKNLGEGGFGEVWLTKHKKQNDRRVFKFCFDADRLRSLKREVTVFRLIKETLGNRNDIGRIFDWNFEEPPFFIEAEFTDGGDLNDWAERQGGLSNIPLETRIEVIAQAATALAAAHSVGVIHKDIKAGNLLIAQDVEAGPRAVLSDFGIGSVKDRSFLADKGITITSITSIIADFSSTSGTGSPLYMAPEIVEGRVASTPADIYSLGVLLYQVVCGDLSRTVASGWERDIHDEILREDIAACVEGNPELRLTSSADLAKRLRTLEERRSAREAERRSAEALSELRKTKKQRQVLLVALALGILFSASITVLAITAYKDRNSALAAKSDANKQRTLANEQRDLAEQRARELDRRFYLIQLRRADRALLEGKYHLGQEELDACPENLRGWEWRYLSDSIKERFPLRVPGAENPVFTRDGKLLVSAGLAGSDDGNNAILWDLSTGLPIRKFKHNTRIAHNALTRDGKFLASGDMSGLIKVWDLESGKEWWSIQGHSNRLDGVQFSPDGQLLASVGWDGFLKVWKTSNGELLFQKSYGTRLRKVIFNHAGNRMVAGFFASDSHALEILSATTGETQLTLPSGLVTMSFSPDDRWIATGGADGGVGIYDTGSGRERKSWSAHTLPIAEIEWSPDGTTLATSSQVGGRTVAIWNASNGRLIDEVDVERNSSAGLAEETIYWLSFSPQGDQIAFFTLRDGITIWNPNEDSRRVTIDAYRNRAESVTFSPNAKYLVTTGKDINPPGSFDYSKGGMSRSSGNGLVRLWDASNGARVSTCPEIEGSCAEFTPNNQIAAVSSHSDKNEFSVYEPSTGRESKASMGSAAEIISITVSQDGNEIVSVDAGGKIRVWDLSNGMEVKQMDSYVRGDLRDQELPWIYTCFDQAGQLACTAPHGAFQAEIWDLGSGALFRRLSLTGKSYLGVAMARDGTRVAFVGWEGWSRVFDINNPEEAEAVRLQEVDNMFSVEFSPDGRQLVTGHGRGTIKFWDIETGQQLMTINGKPEGMNTRVVDLAWSFDGEKLASAREDGTIEIWKLGNLQEEANSEQ
ncbi:MAG: protein kinase, partial [Candidatus Omnitrophica bacterium]|nr:protein kinase [Candidatus Omnitrophota bacterium]